MAEAEFDRAKAKAFTQLMVRHLEGAAVSIMIEVGRRVGLFEAMATLGAVTSVAVAEKTGLSERYVREWLAAMVCGGIVEYAATERTYRLPREHAAGLTGVSSRNLTGMAEMARRFPKSTFVGYDISSEGISEARAAAHELANASFVVQDVMRLEPAAPFDLITAFDAIHDQADPAGVLRRVRAALSPGGTFLMLDVCASSELADNVGVPMAPYLYTMSTMHCMSVSLAGGGPGRGTAWGHP